LGSWGILLLMGLTPNGYIPIKWIGEITVNSSQIQSNICFSELIIRSQITPLIAKKSLQINLSNQK
ncbi:MAG: hypothetical protein ACRCU2_28490, partial [Planktothrix sp.]